MYLDIKQVSAVLGDRLSQALIGFHSFTGCDSVSSFSEVKDRTAEATVKGQTSHGPIHQHRQVVGCYTAGLSYSEDVHLPYVIIYVCIFVENHQSECPAT